MRNQTAKLLRKAFPDRREYRAMKKAYISGSQEQRVTTSKVLLKMRGRTIKRLEIT